MRVGMQSHYMHAEACEPLRHPFSQARQPIGGPGDGRVVWYRRMVTEPAPRKSRHHAEPLLVVPGVARSKYEWQPPPSLSHPRNDLSKFPEQQGHR